MMIDFLNKLVLTGARKPGGVIVRGHKYQVNTFIVSIDIIKRIIDKIY